MNLDFVLFTPPKINYTFMHFWGQVIFIPKIKKVKQKQILNNEEQQQTFSSLFGCLSCSKTTQAQITVDSSLLDTKGFYLQLQEALQQENTSSHSNKNQTFNQQIVKYIPCLYLDSMVKSQYLLIYFHASGQDIKLSHKMLNHLRNSYQANVMAMEYVGYSIHKGKTSSDAIKEEASTVYQFAIEKLGFKEENIIIIGRSIGTGVALELLKTVKPCALVLISPFCNIKSLAKAFAGKIGHYLVKETYDNLANIKQVKCPVFIVHGKKDELILYQNSQQLASNFFLRKKIVLPKQKRFFQKK